MPNEIHDFAHRIPAALGSGSRSSALMILRLFLFLLLLLLVMLLLYMYIHRRASVRSSVQGMLERQRHNADIKISSYSYVLSRIVTLNSSHVSSNQLYNQRHAFKYTSRLLYSTKISFSLYLNGTFHISYNTGFPLASVRLAPWSKSVKERRLSGRTGGVIGTAAASPTLRTIAAAVTAAGRAGPGAGSLSTIFAGTRRARRFRRLRERRRLSGARRASVSGFSNGLRVRSPRVCKSDYFDIFIFLLWTRRCYFSLPLEQTRAK